MAARGSFPICSTAVVAVSLLASSAAAAVPQTVDPLVALSLLGTSESRAALCAGSAAKNKTADEAHHPRARPGCVLPEIATPPAPPSPSPVVVSGGVGQLPLYVGLAAVAALSVVIRHSDSDGEINLPISP